MSEHTSHSRLAVLLCTCNGAAHLSEQLDSIQSQDFSHIDIWVSDDGSRDDTLNLLEHYQNNWTKGHFVIRQGPGRGFAANFLSLACDASIEAEFFAYCDQDDIWLEDKLPRAMKFLQSQQHEPALYCSRTRLIAESGELLNRQSPMFRKPPAFANALVQSLAGGNTMVFNRVARDLLVKAGPKSIISHDWWLYMLVTGNGGVVHFDTKPSVLYRQHDKNLIGSNMSLAAKWRRVRMIIEGDFSDWNENNLRALSESRYLLSRSSKQRLDCLIAARRARLFKCMYLLWKSGVYRQTLMGNIALILAALVRKI